MKITIQLAAIILWLFSSQSTRAQVDDHAVPVNDSIAKARTAKYNNEFDLIDGVTDLIHNKKGKRADDTGVKQYNKVHISGVPAAGYTLQTGFAGLLVANAAFYTRPDANTSTVLTSFTYTVRNQIIVPVQTSIWTKSNKYNIIVDWRYLKFPSYTYGLGGYNSINDGYLIDYSAIRLHQTLLRELAEDMYAGIGYNMDYFYGIEELNPPAGKVTDLQSYGISKNEFASGLTFNFLYDNRKNPINPEKGNFVNVVYRPNLTNFGNTATWRSLVIDLRKYIKFPNNSDNVLAFWSYEWLTVSGKAPYLMLPNTGGDPYSNTGRGYIQGRYRGGNMAYLEGEYRFRITNNGLLGGVVFANAQSFTEQASNSFETVAPGYGAGLRVKLNKFSRTNVAIDYGFGSHGSGGLFVNLGEVF
ncbi:MAG: hypothetical protein JWQ38_308 [Flavipsychrobacter sp.]|nr:hypothetical protein [Flavipsychrobacter sp.]